MGTVGVEPHGFCARCSFRYPLRTLRTETINNQQTALLVCTQCWDPDQPQNHIGEINLVEVTPLRNLAPDEGLSESRELTVTLVDKTVSFVAANTNKINDQGAGGAVDTANFRTSYILGVRDKSLVRTTNAEFSSLCNDAGILGSDFDLDVSSAKLSVGANIFGRTYTNPGATTNAYRVIAEYDPSSVSWNSFGNGGVEGTDYTTEGSVSGVVGSYYVEWDFTDMVVEWLSDENENFGIFFPDMSTSVFGSATTSANVVWTITAKRKLF